MQLIHRLKQFFSPIRKKGFLETLEFGTHEERNKLLMKMARKANEEQRALDREYEKIINKKSARKN